ncbi:MAG: hypothetical protein ACR652_10185 [Methylocystis sp.]|uniref:hypothetical protein n=1 Tax=Methylocystis sp. TaxID=1911079 RepID=UPI003DA28CB2
MTRTKARLTVEIERVCRDGVLAVATARVWIAGVEIAVHGLEVSRELLTGRLRVDAPGVAHNGAIMPAIELPPDLEAAIGREIAGLL